MIHSTMRRRRRTRMMKSLLTEAHRLGSLWAMKKKACFKCGNVLALSEFYKHPRMGDGHLGKCKACTKKDVSANYAKRRKQYSEYDRQRYKDPARRAKLAEYTNRRRKLNPVKAKAWRQVHYALRTGKLRRLPCSSCGSKKNVQAHHEDYSKPLDVVWLCFVCHREHHGQVVTCR